MAVIAAATAEAADQLRVTAEAVAVRLVLATEAGAVAIPRRAATVVADHRTAAAVRMAAVAADMGGNSMLDSWPALVTQHSNTLPSSEARNHASHCLFFYLTRITNL
jgi:hypothetical protein